MGYYTVDGVQNTCGGQTSSSYAGVPVVLADSCSGGGSFPGVYSLNASTTIAAEADLTTLRLSFTLDASAHGQVREVGGPYSHASIEVDDNVTVTGGNGTGFLLMNWLIDGAASASGYFSSVTDVILRPTIVGYSAVACGADFEAMVASGYCSSSQPFLTQEIPFSFGQTIGITTTLTALIGAGHLDGSLDETGGGSVNYFSSPVRLQSVVVLDGNRNPVSDAAVTSDSGFIYLSATEAPEPTTAWLFLVGCALPITRLCLRKRAKGTPAAVPATPDRPVASWVPLW